LLHKFPAEIDDANWIDIEDLIAVHAEDQAALEKASKRK
jgi:hypothetical protein